MNFYMHLALVAIDLYPQQACHRPQSGSLPFPKDLRDSRSERDAGDGMGGSKRQSATVHNGARHFS